MSSVIYFCLSFFISLVLSFSRYGLFLVFVLYLVSYFFRLFLSVFLYFSMSVCLSLFISSVSYFV